MPQLDFSDVPAGTPAQPPAPPAIDPKNPYPPQAPYVPPAGQQTPPLKPSPKPAPKPAPAKLDFSDVPAGAQPKTAPKPDFSDVPGVRHGATGTWEAPPMGWGERVYKEHPEIILDAIRHAEGTSTYGIMTLPKGASEAEARRWAQNTVNSKYAEWEKAGKPGDFIDYLGSKYAPIGAGNDPTNLNVNWVPNVRAYLADRGVIPATVGPGQVAQRVTAPVARAVGGAQATLANLPGVRQAGDIARGVHTAMQPGWEQRVLAPLEKSAGDLYNQTLGRQQPVTATTPASRQIAQVAGLTVDDRGYVYRADGTPVTQSQMDFLLQAFGGGTGPSPGSAAAAKLAAAEQAAAVARTAKAAARGRPAVTTAAEAAAPAVEAARPVAAAAAPPAATTAAGDVRAAAATVGDRLGAISRATGLDPQTIRVTYQRSLAMGMDSESALGYLERQAGIGPSAARAEPPAAQAVHAAYQAAPSETEQMVRQTASVQQAAQQIRLSDGIIQDAREAGQRAAAYDAEHPAATVANPLTDALKKALADERGSIDVKPMTDFLERQAQTKLVAGDIATKWDALQGETLAGEAELRNVIRQTARLETPASLEQIAHAIEAEDLSTLNPGQQRLGRLIQAVLEDTEAVKRATPTWAKRNLISGIGYLRRFVIRPGSLVGRIEAGVTRGGGFGGRLRTTTAAMKGRPMLAAQDVETGARTVVAKEGTRIVGPGREFWGTTARIKTHEELMSGEIAPFNAKIARLDREADTLLSVSMHRTPEAMQGLYADVRSATDDLVHIAQGSMPNLTRQVVREQARLADELRTWAAAGTRDERVLYSRVERVTDHIAKLRQQVAEIQAKYNPADLETKVFEARNGRRYRLMPATMKEIEAQTGIRYYKNPLFSALVDAFETRRAAANAQFLEAIKTDPEILDRVMTPEDRWAPTNPRQRNWVRGPRNSPFQNFRMDKRVAAEVDRIVGRIGQSEDAGGLLQNIEQLARLSVHIGFYNPFIHLPNITFTWAVDRGARRWLDPRAYRNLAISSIRAWNASAHISPEYLEYLRSGAALMRERAGAPEFLGMADPGTRGTKMLLDMAKRELMAKPETLSGLLAEYGRTGKDFLNAPIWASHHITWTANDLLYLQRVMERELEGMPRLEAIAETGKTLATYRLPATIFGQAGISKALQSGAVLFAPYHYSVLKAWGQMTKDLLGKVPAWQRAEAADKLAMAGIIFFGLGAADKALQQATGHRHLTFRRAGVLAPVEQAVRLAHGEQSPEYALESVVTPSPIAGAAIAQFQDPAFTRLGQDPGEAGRTILTQVLQQFMPLSIRQMIVQGDPVGKALLAPIASESTLTPSERAIKGFAATKNRIETQIGQAVLRGDTARAYQLQDAANNRLRGYIRQMYEDEGVEYDPNQAELIVRQFGVRVQTQYGAQRQEQRKQLSPIEQFLPQRGGRTYERIPAPGE